MSNTATKVAKLKEVLGTADDALLERLLASVDTTEKAAEAAGVRFKAADETAEEAPDAEVETKAEGDVPAEDAEAAGEDEAAAEGEAMLLTEGEIKAIAAEVVAQLAPMLGTAKEATAKPADVAAVASKANETAETVKELATKLAGIDTKAAEIASLKERLAVLEGDQPKAAAAGFRASAAAETITNKEQHRAPAADELATTADWLIS